MRFRKLVPLIGAATNAAVYELFVKQQVSLTDDYVRQVMGVRLESPFRLGANRSPLAMP